MSGGWYKQQRNIPERAWFKDANVVLLYTYLKATAYVADGKYEGHIIRRGSCPTTRAEIMEATGLSYKQVDTCLKKLIGYNEIFVKGYSRFSVVTICDYDACGNSNTLFDAYEEQQRNSKGTTEEQRRNNGGTTPPIIYIKEERREEDNLISHSIPYKKEREYCDVALEAKKMYNKEFSGILPPCIRLSTSTRISVEECIRRFGQQSVDIVFQQIKSENFSLGNNKTGFIANFTFIFTPRNYQQYLERAQLARQKKEQVQQKAVAAAVQPEPQPTKEELRAMRASERKKTLLSLTEQLKTIDHRPVWYSIIESAYESGEMAEYGIDWKPDNKTFEI